MAVYKLQLRASQLTKKKEQAEKERKKKTIIISGYDIRYTHLKAEWQTLLDQFFFAEKKKNNLSCA